MFSTVMLCGNAVWKVGVKMDYCEAQEKLSSLTSFGIKPGLQRIEELLRRLGSPQQAGVRYIHVAGTNGKGSTCAMLDAILRESGAKVALFTSPHLLHHCERYRINGGNMPEAVFTALFEEIWQAIEQMRAEGWESPTEFEAATAVALLWFTREQVDYAIIEVGLGGRLDSTNVILPQVSVIASIGLDHMAYLGDTPEQIAAEKAGIIKPGVPVVTAANGPALTVIEACAAARNCPLYSVGGNILPIPLQVDRTGSRFNIYMPDVMFGHLKLSLLGLRQLENAALAVQTAVLLDVSPDDIRSGLLKARWPGRLELWSEQPLIVLDGAHNEPGFQALAESLRLLFRGQRICAVLGMLADKQREEALAHLLPLISSAVITPPPYLARVGDWQKLADICRQAGVKAVAEEDNCRALQLGREQVEQGECDMLLICGSLYLVGELRACLEQERAAEEER